MESSNPIVGSDKIQTIPETAGQTDFDDSPGSIPGDVAQSVQAVARTVAANAGNLADNYAALTAGEQGEVRQSMELMGISIRRARKILRAYGGGKYLRRGIGAALSLNFQFSSLEEGERALRWCRKNYKDTNLPIRERVEILKAMGSVMESIRRLSESSLAIADKFDVQEQPRVGQSPSTLQVGVSINNYPPVAKVPERAKRGVLVDGNGAESPDRAV